MIQMNEQMDILKSKVNMLETNNTKKLITVTGLYVGQKKAQILVNVESFFQNEMDIEVSVEDAYVIGNAKPKIVVVELETLKDKRLILQNKQSLKGKKNAEGNEYYVSAHQTAEYRENTKREKGILKYNEKSNERMKADMFYEKGKLFIEGNRYSKKIHTPTAKDILDIDPKEVDDILKVDLKTGGKIEQDGSQFFAYTMDATTHEQVQKAYLKLKLLYPDARHIVVSHFLPGLDTYYTQDYCDDNEPGAGARLLGFMRFHQLKHKAIFVIRHYGGKRMGPGHFECYVEAAKIAILANPYNESLQINQK